MKAWHFGNTTVRSALRLRDGLLAIKECKLEGNIRGTEGDLELRNCFGRVGLVSLGNDKTNSVGRKWRSAMEKMGFLIPGLKENASDIQSAIGEPDFISKNGLALISSDNLQTWQECYLRALSAYRIPDANGNLNFAPFSFLLNVMLALREKCGSSKLTKEEMAIFVQLNWSNDNADSVVDEIISFRSELSFLTGKPRRDFIKDTWLSKSGLSETTLNDYSDLNFRYIKATGLFKSSHTSVLLDEDKIFIAEEISKSFWQPKNLTEYYQGLCNGAPLPTDNLEIAKETAKGFAKKLEEYGIEFSEDELNSILDVADVNAKRFELEEQLFKIREKEFATKQAVEVEEIIAYLDLLLANKFNATLSNGTEIEIPRSERPAYFEWIVWRAFLAINSIVNPPWESRNFKIDPDFKPLSHAASGSSDLIFEFDDFVLVVEVTLTQSSRQEAAEGEPVRRHVANYVQEFSQSGKRVFGLFLAINIDTNTANTFRLGEWYLPDDSQINVHIVPATLQDFKTLFESRKEDPNSLLLVLRDLLIDCRLDSTNPAPEWKQKISEKFQSTASR